MKVPARLGRLSLSFAVASLLIAGAALAADGALTGQECIADVGLSACGVEQQGLNGAFGVAVSPDGKSVYVASNADDALVRFDRDTATGVLTPKAASRTLATWRNAGSNSRASTTPATWP